jgi:hypothetical protein
MLFAVSSNGEYTRQSRLAWMRSPRGNTRYSPVWDEHDLVAYDGGAFVESHL